MSTEGRGLEKITLAGYRRVCAANGDLARALARTSLAVRCWLDRVGELPREADHVEAGHRRVLAWLLANHLASLFLEVISETLSLANSSPSYIRMRRFVRVRKPFCTASATRTSPIVMPSVSPF